jgi:alpha-D-xyloside xylohydrolase
LVSPLEHIPVYAVEGASIPVYPEPVQCTDEMVAANGIRMAFDDTYPGFSGSILGKVTGL